MHAGPRLDSTLPYVSSGACSLREHYRMHSVIEIHNMKLEMIVVDEKDGKERSEM
jgi:hypothetical protein